MAKRFIILYILLLLPALYINLHADVAVPSAKPLTAFPSSLGDWKMTGESFMDEGSLAVLKPTDYLSRNYRNEKNGRSVGLYIGYHGGGKGTGGIHSPKNCLPGSGWYKVYSRAEKGDFAGGNLNFVSAAYSKGGNTDVFLYWFQVRDASLSDEYQLKIKELTNSFLHRRRDTSFIRISVPCSSQDEAAAVEDGKKFIAAALPAIREYLPR